MKAQGRNLRFSQVFVPHFPVVQAPARLGFAINVTGASCQGLTVEELLLTEAFADVSHLKIALQADIGIRCLVNTSLEVGKVHPCTMAIASSASVIKLGMQVPSVDGFPGKASTTCELTPDITQLDFHGGSPACDVLKIAEQGIRALVNDLASKVLCSKVSSALAALSSEVSRELKQQVQPYLKPAAALQPPSIDGAIDLEKIFWKGPVGHVFRSFLREVGHVDNDVEFNKVVRFLRSDLGLGALSLPARPGVEVVLPWIENAVFTMAMKSATVDVSLIEDLHFGFSAPSAARLSVERKTARDQTRPKRRTGVKMFKNTYQSGFLSILYSIGSKPLQIWDKKVRNGHIKRLTDSDIQSSVLEIMGTNVSTTYITCPADPSKTLGIKLPFLVMIIKNLKKYFTFEVTVLDDKEVRRRFRASNYQSTTRVKPFICTMPMRLDEGWNQIQFNLSDFTRRAYGTNYIETLRVQLHANCRIRRIYFSDRLYSEEELPPEFKLFLPVAQKAQAQAQAQAPAPA
ncbi:Cfap20 [Symbiodinium sp. CCMP2592]|nr:Cfap20 [Symbiodinium sp. CCMP2592]